MQTDSVDALVAPKLKQYAEWRGRWLLWTGDRMAWASQAWVDRIHWNQFLLLSEFGRGLKSALLPGYRLTNALTPNLHYVVWRAGKVITHPLPGLYKLRARAIAAQFAEEVPRTLDDIVIPTLRGDGMPNEEYDTLTTGIGHSLSTWTDAGTLASRLAVYHQRRGIDGPSKTSDTEKDLAIELVRRVGLSVQREGTARITVSPSILKSLRNEAREIVSAVRKAKIVEKDLLAIARIVAEDNQVTPKSHSDPENWVRLVQARRDNLRSRGSEKLAASWVAMEAKQLQFPFLLRSELAECANSKESDVALGDKLLLGRLPAKIKRATLQSIAARAK